MIVIILLIMLILCIGPAEYLSNSEIKDIINGKINNYNNKYLTKTRFSIVDNAMYIIASIDTGKYINWVLDTGFSITTVYSSYAKANDMNISDEKGKLIGGKVVETGVADVSNINISCGETILTIPTENVLVLGTNNLTNSIGGYIGADVLSNFIVCFDFKTNELIFYDKYFYPGNAVALDTSIDPDLNLLLVKLKISGMSKDCEEIDEKFILDSGSPFTIVDKGYSDCADVQKSKKKVKVSAIGNHIFNISTIQPDYIQLGDQFSRHYLWSNPKINVADETISTITTDYQGILGYDILKEFKVFIDYNKPQVYLEI